MTRVIKKNKLARSIIVLLGISFSVAFAETTPIKPDRKIEGEENKASRTSSDTVYLKSGEKINGRVILRTKTDIHIEINEGKDIFVLPNREIDRIEREKPTIELRAEKTTTYINEDIGIKIIGPPQWYMYVAQEVRKADEPLKELLGESYKENRGDSDKIPIQTKVVEFFKYPFAKVLPNPNITLSFFDSFGAPQELKTPIGYMNYSLAKAQKVAQEFKILKGPEKIFINGKEACIATIEFVMPIADISERFKQTRCICFNKNFIVEITATDTSENFDVNEKNFGDCISSLVIFDTVVIAINSELYRTAAGGFIFKPDKKKAAYALLLEPKKAIKDSYYLEIEFENPDDMNKPILTSAEVTGLIKIYSGKKYLALESPDFASLKPFKAYEARVKTYESKDKKKLIDTFAQKIISFYYF